MESGEGDLAVLNFLLIYFCERDRGKSDFSCHGFFTLEIWQSQQVHPEQFFGLLGALLWVVIRNRGKAGRLTGRGMLFMVLLSLYFGFTSTGVDNAAHVGGLICGFLTAVLLITEGTCLDRKCNGKCSGFLRSGNSSESSFV